MAKYTSYKAQIGVNRGAGITDASNLQAKETQEWGRLTDSFARLALNELQEQGALAGRDLALQTKIIDKEVITTDDTGEKVIMNVPVLPKTPDYLGYTATKNFEENLYKRYEADSHTAIDKIITEAYLEAKTKDASPSAIEAIVNEKRKLYIDNLKDNSPIFSELMDDYWEKKFQKTGLAYLEHYDNVRKEESKTIETLNIAKDSAKHIESLISGEDFKHDKFIASVEEQFENGVLTREKADLLINETINSRNFATNFVEAYSAFIGLDRDEIDVNSIVNNYQKNENREKLLALLSNKADAPIEVVLEIPGAQVIVKREDILKLAQGDSQRFEIAKDFLKKTEGVSSELLATKIRGKSFQKQFSTNLKLDRRESYTWEHLKLEHFRADLDKPKFKSQVINSYNSAKMKDDTNFEPITEATAYSDTNFLTWIMTTQGTLPESVHRKYEAAAKSYDGSIITDDVFGILNIQKGTGRPFDYGVTLGFDAKATKILDQISRYVNEGSGVKESFLNVQADNERKSSQEGIQAAFRAKGDYEHYTPGQFFKELHEKVNTNINAYKDRYMQNWLGMDRTLEIGSGFGAYFHGRIFRGILSEIESGQTSVTSSHEMDDAIDRVMARDGFAYKFGISHVSVGVGAKGDFDEEHLVALPPERFMPTLTKDNGWQAFNQIIAGKFRDNPLDMSTGAEYKSLYSHTELKTTGGWLGMVPVNLNHVDNPNLGQDVASGRVDMEYYLVYYDKVKDRVIYPTDKNGDHYIINMEDAKRAEEIRLKLSEDTFIQQKDK